MHKTNITEKEFAVIHEISKNHRPNQRIIAKRAGISLGLTNIIIKRLVNKGCLKVQEIPPRRIQYILTPKGLTEKARKSYDFTLETIKRLKAMRASIQEVIVDEVEQGADTAVIYGRGELATLAEVALRDMQFKNIDHAKPDEKYPGGKDHCSIVFRRNGSQREIDIVTEISKRGVFINP